jgi:hypothetical protein
VASIKPHRLVGQYYSEVGNSLRLFLPLVQNDAYFGSDKLDYRKPVILSRSATSIEEVLSVKGPPIAVWPSTNKHLELDVVRVPYSAAVAIATRGQDGLGTGCHHFATPSSFAITFAAL